MTQPQPVATVPTVDEFDRKTISLTADLIASAMDDAGVLEGIPHGAVLILLPDDDPGFVEESIGLGIEAVRQGRDVVFRHAVHSAETPALGSSR